MKNSDGFSSKLGFVLAAAGSAVGLGNIWRFPYLTARYGGGIFLLIYFILVLTFGYFMLISETGIGRITRRGPIGAYRKLCRGKSSFLGSVRIGGYINSLVPMLILPYYCVIGGWITKYLFALASTPINDFSQHATTLVDGKTIPASVAYFENFISNPWSSLGFFLIFVALMIAVVAFGVQRGVERFNKILMPLLILLIVGICIYSAFLPGTRAGYIYYLKPDWSKFSIMTIVAAIGQLFFSLSIAMGIMITYGSYMRKKDDLISSVNHIEIFDTAVSFLAGLMIIPAVVAFGGEKAAANAGPGLVFVTMPQVFANFSGGQFFGTLFFLLVLFAAATSAISLLETNVQTVSQEFIISRRKSIFFVTVETLAIGIITILGYSVLKNVHPLGFIAKYQSFDILDSLDFISNNILMPIGAIFTVVLVVAVVGLDKFIGTVKGGRPWRRQYLFELGMTILVIPALMVILLDAIGLFNR